MADQVTSPSSPTIPMKRAPKPGSPLGTAGVVVGALGVVLVIVAPVLFHIATLGRGSANALYSTLAALAFLLAIVCGIVALVLSALARQRTGLALGGLTLLGVIANFVAYLFYLFNTIQ